MKLYASHGHLKPHLHFPVHGNPRHTTPPFSSPKPLPNSLLSLKPTPPPRSTTSLSSKPSKTPTNPSHAHPGSSKEGQGLLPRWAVLGGASLTFAFLLFGFDGHHEALAFGPEGPLVEEFWDNMRRYGLYILTVSTGVIYTVFQPIVELLKNPITAILLLVVVVGAGFIVSQVLNAMVGISEFSYNYGY